MSLLTLKEGLKKFSKAYCDEPLKIDINSFREQLKLFIKDIEQAKEREENEEFFKKLINDFLSKSFNYSSEYKINTKSNIDSAIYSNSNNSKKVHVITEVKTPKNEKEMLSKKNINAKALHEMILYYLSETRLISGNKIETNFEAEVQHLIATNSFEWFVFDAVDLEKIVSGNIENYYYKHFNGLKEDKNNPKFYEYLESELNKKNINKELDYIYFNIEDYSQLDCLVYLYKIFSQDFLIKKKYQTKVSEHILNKKFYHELLYILGFEEKKDKQSKVYEIRINHNVKNTFANQIYQILVEEKEYKDEKANELTIQLVILWMNRLLFIKLFEGQLLLINGKSDKYHILDKDKIKDFETLHKLFFEVLGKRDRETGNDIVSKFDNVPYLNSSLFELDNLEKTEGINIKRVRNAKVKLKSNSVLNEIKEKELFLIDYLLNFLNSYNFGAEVDENNVLKEGKDIIDASVLGLIFEKINGYKDGSYYTQSVITDYIAKESINCAIIDKINEVKKWNCTSFDDIINQFNRTIGEAREINEIINSVKICDIAVGSGHFLVSALNQILYIKWQLGILLTKDKKDFIKNIKLEIDDGALIVKDECDNKIYYKRDDIKTQIMQEMLFEEKKVIIENCLFGVDINSNAVNICRLRLWIELLKSAYYKKGKMEILPNIDINIKSGNSLIEKFSFNVGKKIYNNSDKSFTKGLNEYKKLILAYKTSADKVEKNDIKSKIKELKSSIKNSCMYDNVRIDVDNNEAKLVDVNQPNITLYKNSMEWAFEFPEILNENGVFNGFDVIIGNPPYIDSERMSLKLPEERKFYSVKYSVAKGNWDIFVLFIERALMLMKYNGYLSFIVPNKLLYAPYASETRKLMINKNIMFIRDYSSVNVFPDADVYTIVFCLKNSKEKNQVKIESMKDLTSAHRRKYVSEKDFYASDDWGKYINTTNSSLNLIEKLNKYSKLSDYVIINDPATTGEAYLIKDKLVDKNVDSTKYAKLINTGAIDPYMNYWGIDEIKYLKNDYLYPVISINDLKNISNKRFNEYKNKKIIVAGMAKKIEAYYDDGNYLAGKSTKIIQLKDNIDNIDLVYITGLINSKVINFYLLSKYGKAAMSKGYITIKKEMLYDLPIENNITKTIHNKIVSLVLDIQNKYKMNNNKSSSIVDRKKNELEETIYNIYGITDAERKNIEKVTI